MPKKRKGERLPQIRQLPSGSWTAKIFMYTDESGKDHYQSVTSRDYDEVVRRLAQLRADRKETKQTDPKERLTVGDAIDRYIESKENVLSPSTVCGYRQIRRNNFQGIMKKNLYELTQEDVQKAVNQDATHLSPKSIRNAYGLLRASCDMLRHDFRIDARMPQKDPPHIEIPTEQEVMTLIRVSHGTDMEVPILLASCCGLRRSEIVALRWEDVDLEAGILHVRHAKVRGEGGIIHEKAPKTDTSARTITMPKMVTDAMKEAHGTSVTEYVTNFYSPDQISKHFDTILRRSGLKNYRFHDLRHYLVSVMLMQGVPKKYIADYVGHSTEAMIDRVYGHIMASKKTEVQDIMKNYFDELQKQNQK